MNCRQHERDVGPISWAGNCMGCAQELLRENIQGLADHTGEPMRRWRVGMILCAGGTVSDDLKQAS